jgi:hypothetical protein
MPVLAAGPQREQRSVPATSAARRLVDPDLTEVRHHSSPVVVA